LAKKPNDQKDIFYQFTFLANALLLVLVGPLLVCLGWLIDHILSDKWADMTLMLPPFLLASFMATTIALADQLLIIKSNLKRYLGFGLTKAIVATLAIVVSSFWGAKAIAWSYIIYHTVLFFPMCSIILRGAGFNASEANAILKSISLIVFSSTTIVAIPWLMVTYANFSIPMALGCYLVGAVFLFAIVWPLLGSFKTFKNFSRILLSRRIFLSSRAS
jgi:hypothetical protein